MNEETETTKPADVAGRLDGLVSGTPILWRWKDKKTGPYSEGWIRETGRDVIKVADSPFGWGYWLDLDEIEYKYR